MMTERPLWMGVVITKVKKRLENNGIARILTVTLQLISEISYFDLKQSSVNAFHFQVV